MMKIHGLSYQNNRLNRQINSNKNNIVKDGFSSPRKNKFYLNGSNTRQVETVWPKSLVSSLPSLPAVSILERTEVITLLKSIAKHDSFLMTKFRREMEG